MKEIYLNFKFAIRLCIRYNRKLFFIKLLRLILNWLLTFTPMLLVKEILNSISEGLEARDVLVRGSVYFILIFAVRFFCLLTDKISDVERQYLEKKYRSDFVDKAVRVTYEKLESSSFRNVIQLADNGQNVFEYVDYVFNFVGFAANLVSCIGIICSLNVVIALISLLPCIVKGVISAFQTKENARYFKVLSTIYRKEKYIENQSSDVSGAKEIRVNSLQDWFAGKYRELMKEQDRQGKKLRVLGVLGDVINNFAAGVQSLSVNILTAYNVIYQGLYAGDFTMYLNAVFLFSDSLGEIIALFARIRRNNVFISSLRLFMMENNSDNAESQIEVAPEVDSIRFENVSFRYPGSDEYALKNVSFTLHKGERVMIIGKNGAGKSTFIKLLCRLYKASEGSIYLYDVNVNEISYDDYISRIGTVFQDFTLIAATVRENTSCSLSAEREKLDYAYRESRFDDILKTMPNGEYTDVYKTFNENGVELSGGQAQKLAIARLLYRTPSVYVLDEPTSALDPAAEYEMYSKFKKTVNEKTSVFISHRLSGADTYDRIVVFENGSIAEEGSFGELMKKNGVFAEMYRVQSGYYKGNAEK